MQARTGVQVRYHGGDMTKPAEIADMVAFAKREFGRLDILINNAGVQHIADRWTSSPTTSGISSSPST